MDFEEMQVVWDSQQQRKLYAIDQEALHEIIRKRSRCLGCQSNWEDYGMMAVCLFLVLALGLEPLLRGTDPHQYVGAALFAGVGVLIWLDRRKRLERESSFEATLTGDLSRAIFRVESRIRQARSFVWWFLGPAAVVVALSYFYSEKQKSANDWLLVIGSFFLSFFVVEWTIRRRLIPTATELDRLRDKLANEA